MLWRLVRVCLASGMLVASTGVVAQQTFDGQARFSNADKSGNVTAAFD